MVQGPFSVAKPHSHDSQLFHRCMGYGGFCVARSASAEAAAAAAVGRRAAEWGLRFSFHAQQRALFARLLSRCSATAAHEQLAPALREEEEEEEELHPPPPPPGVDVGAVEELSASTGYNAGEAIRQAPRTAP
jgi:hypothetical protein